MMRKNEKGWMHEMQKSKPGLVGAPGELHLGEAATAMACCCMNLLLIEHFFNNQFDFQESLCI